MPEELLGEYMRATRVPPAKGRKTSPYEVSEIATGAVLGDLRWYGPWRGYCFFPAMYTDHETIFDHGCLAQLAEWIRTLNTAYKAQKGA